MNKKKLRLISAAAAALVVAAAAAVSGYYRFAAPTKIAFVNYPEYVLAPMLDQEIDTCFDIRHLPWSETSGRELAEYDCVIFFGMGLNFTEEQSQIIAALPVPVYTTASTRQETALAAMTPEQKDAMDSYFRFGGKANFRRMLDYVRYELDGKRINAPVPEAAKEVERKPFFHAAEGDAFKTPEEYMTWYRSSPWHKPGSPLVCIIGGNGTGDLGDMINAFEQKELDVIAVSGMWPGRQVMEVIDPDVIVYHPHGRLGEEAVSYLKEKNIPLFCPVKVNQPYEEFLRDQRGMTGGMLSQSITMPELDGGVAPFVVSALFRNERGLQEYRMIPERLERFSELIRKTALLQQKPNSEKKIAMIYYGSIGKEAATAGLGTSQSVLNILRHLQSLGYNTGELPEDIHEFDRELKANTAVFGKIGGGAESAPAHVRTVTITPEEYSAWVKKSMPDDLYEEVTARYGDFPGKLFRTAEGNMSIGCIRFGNIILMPQSLPGEGNDENTLIHGVKMAPPHTYIATYLYLQHGFEADALMHLGTHGSLEFTPWKQVALSSYDWPDVLIGSMPHYYLYIINNIGEAQIAKRRTYAAMVSHLTPPFMNTEAYGPIAALLEKLHHFETADNLKLKSEYGRSIIEIVREENIHRDIDLSENIANGELSEEDMLKLQEYLHDISDAKVNRGVYIIGRPYSESEADETAILMSEDYIAEMFFEADVKAGAVEESKRKDSVYFRRTYLARAREAAAAALAEPEKFIDTLPPASSPAAGGPSAGDIGEMLKSGKLPDGRPIPPEMLAAIKNSPVKKEAPPQKLSPEAMVLSARRDLLASTGAELEAIVNAFAGGYLAASPGGDPVLNPSTVPTGKNLYGIDPERTPTRESFEIGKQLAEELIREKLDSTGKYPRKVGFSLWGGEFIRTQGVNIGEIFYLLGVEPVWDSRGRVLDVRLIPASELGRPRIDVVIQTSGQFRGAATSRMKLIDKAVMLAASDPDGEFGNYVRESTFAITRALTGSGMPPEEARKLAFGRIFGGVNGNFGTGAMGMAQSTGTWDDAGDVAELYLNNMGAVYTEGYWGEHKPEMFRAALADTDTVVQSRSSNSWGPLSLDHVYEFTGGMSLAARHVNGSDPDAYFNDLRTPGRVRIQEAGEAAMAEARSTVLNPGYITEMMDDGAAATGYFAEVFRNTMGWEVMKPDMLEDHLWQEYKEVYVDDKLAVGTREFFEENNPAALHEMTGIMLEAARKEFWHADEADLKDIAETHVELMKKFDLPPVDNVKLQEMTAKYLDDPALQEAFREQIAKAQDIERLRREKIKAAEEAVSGMTMKEQNLQEETGDSAAAVKVIALTAACIIAVILLGNIRRIRSKKSKR